MSAEHRKPVVAFVALLFLAGLIISVQRADALSAGFHRLVTGSAPTNGEPPGVGAEGDQPRLAAVAPGYFGQDHRTEEQPEGRRSLSEATNRGGHARRPAVSNRDSAPLQGRGQATGRRLHRPALPAADARGQLAGAERSADRPVTRAQDTARAGGKRPESRRSGVVPRRHVGQGPRHGGDPMAR